MMKLYTPRQIEVLTMLSKYGVLGIKTIHSLMKEKVSIRRLRESLQIMESHDLISRFTLGTGGSPMSYWILPDENTAKGRAIHASGLDAKYFRNKRARYSHIPHENSCTLVQASIERQMPFLWIYRESTAAFKNLPSHLISEKAVDSGNIPDMCVGVPSKTADIAQSNKGYRWIGVEVDRTNRSKKRIAQRLNIYTKHTGFSGLLYLVPNMATVISLREIYSTRTDKNTYRLRGSTKSFLGIGVTPADLFDVNAMRVWWGEHEIPLSTWLSLFALSESHERDQALSGLSPFGRSVGTN